MLQHRTRLPEIVFLSACHSESVADVFVEAGVRHVIAIRGTEKVLDRKALEFTDTFYSHLLMGKTVAEAFEIGRTCLRLSTDCPEEAETFLLLPATLKHNDAPLASLQPGEMTVSSQALPPSNCWAVTSNFLGRDALVQQVFQRVLHAGYVNTLIGPPGIGKTQVALKAVWYARERRLLKEIFFVSLTPAGAGLENAATAGCSHDDMEALYTGFGLTEEKPKAPHDRLAALVAAIGHRCEGAEDDQPYLLVLDGCRPWVTSGSFRTKCVTLVDCILRCVPKLRVLLTSVAPVRPVGEKVLKVEPLDNLSAAQLFLKSTPRDLGLHELTAGMVAESCDAVRVFAQGEVISHLAGHPGVILAVSGEITPASKLTLLKDEHEIIYAIIPSKQAMYAAVQSEYDDQVATITPSGSPDLSPRGPRDSLEPQVMPLQLEPYWVVPCATAGEETWCAACSRSAAASGPRWTDVSLELRRFLNRELAVPGPQGDASYFRPLKSQDLLFFSRSRRLWKPGRPPAELGGKPNKECFFGTFWPWFHAAVILLRETKLWLAHSPTYVVGFQSEDASALLHGQAPKTFVLRVSAGMRRCLVVCYLDSARKMVEVPVKVEADGTCSARVQKKTAAYPTLASLILSIDSLEVLYPDTPKAQAFGPGYPNLSLGWGA
ncbi:unnamed protein product [Chrysoparadoxa australica]